ncbi:hypothetical protein AGDE_08875 [Angomonas deanei]|nr:hypothetical protein AGDE_08875 [Angomonas deanei]|eukprot:EPY32081.1 hypothetical protein AGDE_08875 [Angomonas deanei]
MDSPCYHAAGPLGDGNIIEIEELGVTCIECPWHRYLVNIKNGEEIIMEEDDSNEVRGPAPIASVSGLPQRDTTLKPKVGRKNCQRTHRVELIPDDRLSEKDKQENREVYILKITVEEEGVQRQRPMRSDGCATSLKNGGLCMQIQDIKAKGL